MFALRVTFTRAGTIDGWTDYEPWGMPMVGRMATGSLAYRYGFQGQETDQISGVRTPAFELRLWDSRIGRWTAPDPYGQFWSPYLGMGNNPAMAQDGDGRLVIFVNGYNLDHEMASRLSGVRGDWGATVASPPLIPYPTYDISLCGPSFLGKEFPYWEGMDGLFSERFNDWNQLYVNGSDRQGSQGADRFAAGQASGRTILEAIKNGGLKLAEGETINSSRIAKVGHMRQG